MQSKSAFITGVTGQDGSYLAELLLEKGYEVHAILRRSSIFTTERIEHILEHPRLHIDYGDLTDSSNLHRLLGRIKPDEIYNLAAQSHVRVSFDVPEYTAEVDAIGTIRLLDAVRDMGIKTRFFQASTSELFGGLPGTEPQNEQTSFYPKSPYSAAKLHAFWAAVNYREAYGLFTCNGILFNHESPRRGLNFVTKKITAAVARIAQGQQQALKLGNLNAKRDWGYAPEYVEMMWMMLQHSCPLDLIAATGLAYTVRDFASAAFREAGFELEWSGSGENEKGIDRRTGQILVEIDPTYYRPTEAEILCGNAAKAKKVLGWEAKTSFAELVKIMVNHDLAHPTQTRHPYKAFFSPYRTLSNREI